MKLTVSLVLMLIVLVFCVLHALGKAPLWPAVLILALDRLIQILPQ